MFSKKEENKIPRAELKENDDPGDVYASVPSQHCVQLLCGRVRAGPERVLMRRVADPAGVDRIWICNPVHMFIYVSP